MAMTFSVNDWPLAGQDGDKVTSRQIRERLCREAEGNVAIRVQLSRGRATRSRSPAAASCSSRC